MTPAVFPYKPGLELELHRHTPPDPFGSHNMIPYGRCTERLWNVYCNAPDYWDENRIQFALEYPPIETKPPVAKGGKLTMTAKFVVHRVIEQSQRSSGGPTLLEGKFYRDRRFVRNAMAKVYDGVFYSVEGGYGYGYDAGHPDPMIQADLDYSIESAAYEDIQTAGHCGSFTPQYYGSWTFSLETNEDGVTGARQVRMILLEKVEGAQTMAEVIRKASTKQEVSWYSGSDGWVLDRERLPPVKDRLKVLKNLLEAWDRIWWDAKVSHYHLSPEDVLIRQDNTVAIINFEQATVYSWVERWGEPGDMQAYPDHPRYAKDAPSLQPNPLCLHWPFVRCSWPCRSPLVSAACWSHLPPIRKSRWWQWIPEDWVDNPELAAIWLLETFKSADPNIYGPLPDSFLNSSEQKGRDLIKLLENLGRKKSTSI